MAKNVIRQDVVQIGFDIDNKFLNQLSKDLDQLKKELKGDLGEGSLDELAKSSKQAKESVNGIKTSVDDLTKSSKKTKESVSGVGDALGDTKSELDKTKISLGDTKDALGDTKSEADKFKKSLTGAAGITFDKVKSGLKSVGKAFGAMVKKAAKWTAAGIGAGTAALTKVVKDSVMAYADREQFIGGVETMFKGDAGTIQKYANDAYKTAGLSANEYMESVTSFSASLISGLGGDTKKAAEYANTALTDMSDNANKFGTGMDMIQNAYQGFAKQNYMMLDNLKLGYGGTKTEMQRLIKNAAKIDKSIKANDLSFGNIVKAIHVVQKEMDITGTTAKEASTTILGSFNSMKSAWRNLLPALIEGGDSFDQCINNLVDSAETFLKNLKPALTKAVSGIGDLIDRLAPTLEEEVPKLVNGLLPPLIRAATKIVVGLIKELPNIVRTLVPELIKAIYGGFRGQKLTDGSIKALKGKVDKLMPVILGIAGALAGFKVFGKLKGVFDGITKLFNFNSKSGKGGLDKGLFSNLAKTNIKTVLKGMANLAIILGGMTLITGAFMVVAPSIAKLSDLKSVLKVIAVVGLLGILGAALSKLASVVGLIPISTVLQGLANMTISLLGFGVLAAAFVWISPHIDKLGDFKSILKVTAIMSILGILGAALTAFAGVAGLIPTPIILTGMANIALVLGGLGVLIFAFGALSKIRGFNDFIKSGSKLLIKLFKTLGEMVGSIVGGIGESITNSLPKMGENLTGFAKRLKPMFDIFNGSDMTGVCNFFKEFGKFMLLMAGEKALSFLTGKANYAELGTQLSNFAANAKGFFNAVADMPETGFTNAKLFFETLAGVKGLPKEGGVFSWFTGNIAYDSLSNGLRQLSNDNVKNFFAFCADLNHGGFESAKGLFACLAEVKSLPKEGGVFSWFTGNIAYDSLVYGLSQLSSEGVRSFFTWLSSVNTSVFEKTKQMFNSLAEIKSLPAEGGVVGWFTGSIGEGITSLTDKLPAFGASVASFYAAISTISDFTKINQLFTALSGIDGAVENEGGFFNWVKDSLGGDAKTGLQMLGEALLSFGNNTKDFFSQINVLDIEKLQSFWFILREMGTSDLDVSSFNNSFHGMISVVQRSMAEMATTITMKLGEIKRLISSYSLISAGQLLMDSLIAGINSKRTAAIATAAAIAAAIKTQFSGAVNSVGSSINRMIGGANFILKELGSDKRLNTWSYAKGTSGHKGGNAIVNDGRGAELVQMPNGNAFIPKGRNVFIPNAPKGMKVMSAEQTATIMGKDSPTFHYANGVGDIWSYIDNSDGLAAKIINNIEHSGISFAQNVSKALANTVKSPMSTWIKKTFNEFGGGNLVATCRKYLGVPYVWGGTSPTGFDCSGLMQYVYAKNGKSIPRVAASQFAAGIPIQTPRPGDLVFFKGALGTTSRPGHVGMFIGNGQMIHAPQTGDVVKVSSAFRKDYLGARWFANGGIATTPSVFGEAGAEMAIPLSKAKRKRGLSLWEQTGDLLGAEKYTPENSVLYSKNQTTEYNTYSPQLMLNISGSTDEMEMERKVKRWIQEAMSETFDSISRKSPRLQEI